MDSEQHQEITINHIALYVEDLNASVHFYKNILGFEEVEEPFKDGLHAWFSIGANLTLHIIQGKKNRIEQYLSTHTCFSVKDIDLFIQHLGKISISYCDSKRNLNQVTTRPDGIKQIYFKDPDDYWIEVNNDKL